MQTPNIELPARDRRRRLRFPLETELRYSRRGGAATRTGQVVNISSRGLAFRTDGPLEVGWRLSVSMAWPAKLDACMLRLAFEGVVLRVHGNLAVVTIDRPEFRTAGKSTADTREEIATLAGSIESMALSGSSPGGDGGAYGQQRPTH